VACKSGGGDIANTDSTKVDSSKSAIDSTKKDTLKVVVDSTMKDSTKK